ncbi:hypothetical protein Ddc_03236 [Ditylenchus destructor]|nr:hypothetical protein Ddc_03236 [Ditylenchus destructor]
MGPLPFFDEFSRSFVTFLRDLFSRFVPTHFAFPIKVTAKLGPTTQPQPLSTDPNAHSSLLLFTSFAKMVSRNSSTKFLRLAHSISIIFGVTLVVLLISSSSVDARPGIPKSQLAELDARLAAMNQDELYARGMPLNEGILDNTVVDMYPENPRALYALQPDGFQFRGY